MVKDVIKKSISFEGTNYQLYYSLVDSSVNIDDESYTTYGVSVELESDGQIHSKSSIDDIFTCPYEAQKFIEIISENYVTPCTLCDIVEEVIL